MKIGTLEVTQAAELTDFYNEQFSDLPHYHRVTPQEFDKGVRLRLWVDEPYKQLSGEKLIIGTEGGRIVAFSHIAKDRNDDCGTFRFFSFHPSFRAVAQAILSESEHYLRELGVSEFWVHGGKDLPGYRFHRMGWYHPLTNTMGHLRGLFGGNDYQLAMTEDTRPVSNSFMVAPLACATEPNLPWDDVEISVDAQMAGDKDLNFQPERLDAVFLTILAHRDGHQIGDCESWPLGIFVGSAEAEEVF